MAASTIHIKEATVITPADQTPTHTLALSAVDSQLFLRFTIEYLLVYRPSSGSDSTALVSRVKAGLSKALVPYYPLAGRVRVRTDGNGLEVVCRGQGALFINAVSSEEDTTFVEFARAPRRVNQWRKLLSFHVADVLLGAPVVIVQLTWLKDGTVTLGVGFNHCVCDGIGSAEFLNLFAQLTRGGRLSDNKPKPVWQRHLLSHLNPSHSHRVESVSRRYHHHHHPEFVKVPDLSGFVSRFNNERLIPTSITFDKMCLTELKRLVNSPSRFSESSTYTSFEVLAGHIWRSWARSLNLPLNQTLKLLFSVNVRERVKPSLPSGFYGNAFVLGCAQTSVKELTEKQGLSHAAMLVKRAKDRVDTEYVKSVVESVSGATRLCPDSVGVLILTQWSRLGLERVDFGLGRPVHVAPICCDRYCLFLPVYNQTDAVRVMVAVPMSGVEKYERLVRECMVR